MEKIKVALVSATKRLSSEELNKVAGALQTQLERDFQPVWNIAVQLRPFVKSKDVPHDYWPVTIRDQLETPGMMSFHSVNKNRPYVEVLYGEFWTLGASHDLIEMLVDPQLNRVARANSIKPGEKHQVDYYVQACDPCADPQNGYKINGVLVADFSTPNYWKSTGSKDAKYSHTGALKKPLEVARGGYLSWRDPRTKHGWRKTRWADKPRYEDLGVFALTEADAVGDGDKRDGVRVVHEQRIRIQMVMLREFYRGDAPRRLSIRTQVEQLIDKFGVSAPSKHRRSDWPEVRANDLNDLYSILNELSDTQAYVFRGQASAEWNLDPSLHRTLRMSGKAADNDRDYAGKILTEATAIRAFRRHARSLLHPSELAYFDNRLLDGITLMQHYGAPTRLLDWTLSPWVACYFSAQGEDDSDGALWAFNQDELFKANHQRRGSRAYARFLDLVAACSIDDWAIAALHAGPHIDVFRYQYANAQMGAQQSLFTVSGQLGDDHNDALARNLPDAWQRLKIVFPSICKEQLRKRLFGMNASALALFPTPDGVGRYIRESVQCRLSLGDEGLLWVLEEKSSANKQLAQLRSPSRRARGKVSRRGVRPRSKK